MSFGGWPLGVRPGPAEVVLCWWVVLYSPGLEETGDWSRLVAYLLRTLGTYCKLLAWKVSEYFTCAAVQMCLACVVLVWCRLFGWRWVG